MTCGSRLPGAPTPAPGPVAPAQPQYAPQLHQPQPLQGHAQQPDAQHNLAPTPFTGSPAAPPALCGRCHGSNDPGSTFCRFCGAQLGPKAMPSVAAAPSPAPLPEQLVDRGASAAGPATEVTPRPTDRPAPTAAPPAKAERPPSEAGGGAARGLAADPVASLPEPATAKSAKPPAEAIPSRSAPKSEARGRVVVVAKDGSESASFPLQERVDVGRYEGELRFPEDPYLSARHLRIYERAGTYYAKDLGTLNGTFLRLRHGESIPIEPGTLFLVGQQLLRLVSIPPEEEIPAAAREHGVLLFGTPPFPRYARLEQRSVEGTTLDVYHLHKTETVLGRESGDVVFSDDAFLSRRHAAVRFDRSARTFELVDLHSSNGSFARLGNEVELRHRDQVRVGQQLLRIELNDVKSNAGKSGGTSDAAVAPRSKG